MAQTYQPISEVFLYGSVAFRYYANNYRGEVEYFGKIGKPIKDKATGLVDILPWIFDKSNRDHLAATGIVANKLEELKNAAFQQSVNSQNVRVSSVDQKIIIADESVEPQPIAEPAEAQPTAGLKVVSQGVKVA